MKHNFYFKETCYACPEQYDVFDNDELIAYVRLRHGHLYCSCNNTVIYEEYPNCDGRFNDEKEREYYLSHISIALVSYLEGE